MYITFDKEAFEKALRSIGVTIIYEKGLHGLPEARFANEEREHPNDIAYPIAYAQGIGFHS